MKTSAVDLFCGIGGLSYGLKKAGISVVAGMDTDESCRFAFEHNVGGEFIPMDISVLRGNELAARYWPDDRRVTILAGCAPCQPFSPHSNKLKKRTRSKRWRLIREFGRIVREAEPDIVTMENVPNLANQKIFEEFVDALKQDGYAVSYSDVYCPDYGIPQKRRRLVLLASRFGTLSLVPRTHREADYVTLRDAIGDLPPVKAGETCPRDPLHRASKLSDMNLRRIQASKPNGTWLDWDEDLKLACHRRKSGGSYRAICGRLSWDEPSSTITTQFYTYGTGRFGHPSQDRALTLREAALLQTFPMRYRFYRSEADVVIKRFGRHIGNAVPVALGAVIGRSILAHLGGHDDAS